MSEALIFASTNQQYDNKLFIVRENCKLNWSLTYFLCSYDDCTQVKWRGNLDFETIHSEPHVVLKSWTNMILELLFKWPEILNFNYLHNGSVTYLLPWSFADGPHRSNRQAILNLKSVYQNLTLFWNPDQCNGVFNLNLIFEILIKKDYRMTCQLTGNLEFELQYIRSDKNL